MFSKEFVWVDKSADTGYKNWIPDEPTYTHGGEQEQCTEMFPTGGWNDLPCSFGRAYVCKKPIGMSINSTVGQYHIYKIHVETHQSLCTSIVQNAERCYVNNLSGNFRKGCKVHILNPSNRS